MKRLLFLSFLTCFLLPLSAQTPDPIESHYIPIFQDYEERLEELGYPVGRAGNAAYVPGQYVLKYTGANAAADFQADFAKLKRRFGNRNVSLIGECGCSDEFQLYNIELKNVGGEERGKAGKNKVAQAIGQEEVEPNFYVIPELDQLENHPDFNQLPPNFKVIPSTNRNAPVTIAVLDSGIDPYFQHPQTTNGMAPLYLWENEEDDKDDPFCFEDDIFGWDFINDDNAPLDDHSHGTHIASRIAQQLKNNAPDVNYRFMSLKMLDHDGVGTTFHASCAVLYAAHHKADVINASWGFYGESDNILRGAFEYAESRGVATMNSAGNYRRDLSSTRHYPSEFALEANPIQSIFFVSATRTGTLLWPLTNFRSNPGVPGSDFMAAPGGNLLGLMPHHMGYNNNLARKRGTSIAVPFASALAAHYHHLHPNAGPVTLRSVLMATIEAQGAGATVNYNGQVLPYKVFNWVILP